MIGGMTIFIVCFEQIMFKITYPIISKYVKDQDNPVLKHRRSVKACRNFFQAFYFISTTIYGFNVLGNSLWLPWYMGG